MEMTNELRWFPPELEDASPIEKNRYRAKKARAWDRAIAKIKGPLVKGSKLTSDKTKK
jgi:hypothetical protein